MNIRSVLRSSADGLQGFFDFFAKPVDVDSSKYGRTLCEAPQRPVQQRHRSRAVSFAEMVHGRGDLDECLQKAFLRLVERQPNEFPMLVGIKELCLAIAGKPIREWCAAPVEDHVSRIS